MGVLGLRAVIVGVLVGSIWFAEKPDSTDHDVYSAVLPSLPLSHHSIDERDGIIDRTFPATGLESYLSDCARLPETNAPSLKELTADYVRRNDVRLSLGSAFETSKQYILISEKTEQILADARFNPRVGEERRERIEGFEDVTRFVRLSNVFYDRRKRFAVVHVSVECGSLCGTRGWHFLERDAKGYWRPSIRVESACGQTIS